MSGNQEPMLIASIGPKMYNAFEASEDAGGFGVRLHALAWLAHFP